MVGLTAGLNYFSPFNCFLKIKIFLFLHWLYVGEDGKPVTMMNATLSYDSEAMSPVAAANFMSLLQSFLEAPQNLLLGQQL